MQDLFKNHGIYIVNTKFQIYSNFDFSASNDLLSLRAVLTNNYN